MNHLSLSNKLRHQLNAVVNWNPQSLVISQFMSLSDVPAKCWLQMNGKKILVSCQVTTYADSPRKLKKFSWPMSAHAAL